MPKPIDYALDILPYVTTGVGGILGATSTAKRIKEKHKTPIEPSKIKRYEGESEDSYQSRLKRSMSQKERYRKDEKRNAAVAGFSRGALGGLFLGYGLRGVVKPYRDVYRAYRGGGYKWSGGGSSGGSTGYYSRSGSKFQESKDLSDALKKARTKADAKKAYRQAAVKSHPDKGGSDEVFKDVKNEWDEFMSSGKFDKLAFLRAVYNKSFNDGFEKIAVSQKKVINAVMDRLLSSRVDNKLLANKHNFNIYTKLLKNTGKMQKNLSGASENFKPFDRSLLKKIVETTQLMSESPMKYKLRRVQLSPYHIKTLQS